MRRIVRQDKQRIQMVKKMVKKGYVLTPDGKFEHREVYKAAHGAIPHGWVVHHIDEVKSNNVPENLVAMPREMHNRMHHTMKQNHCTFTRVQIEAMIKAYTKLSFGKYVNITINVTISPDQIVKTVPLVTATSARSGSSSYR